MPADEDRFRSFATDHFLTHGLGGKLGRDASLVIRALVPEAYSSLDRFAPILACGSILERTCWLGLGHWLGYFTRNIPPLSTQEKEFLAKGAEALRQHPWPDEFAQVLDLLLNLDVRAGTSFFNEQIVGSALPRNSRESWPVFQAAHMIAEDLTEGPIRAFFRFLHEEDIEEFRRQSLSAEIVFDSLRHDEYFDDAQEAAVDQPEAVAAGFIRYTEFLSAMDNLFPSAGAASRAASRKDEANLTPEEKLLAAIFGEQAVAGGKAGSTGGEGEISGSEGEMSPELSKDQQLRELLAQEIKGIIQWRIARSTHARRAYYAVQSAFAGMALEQFRRYPSSGLSWAAAKTQRELSRLSSRFFAVPRSARLELKESQPEAPEQTKAEIPEAFERLREMEGGQRASEAGSGEFAVEE